MSTKPDLKAIHDQAMKRADEAYSFEKDNIRKGREDQKFYFGDQWDEAAKLARGTDRPMLTVPRLGTFVRQVTGDLRQNTPAVKVLPSGGNASQEKAEVFGGIIRSIEAKSDAAACYVKGASNAAETGQGAFRILTKYCDDDSFDQDIVIERIADPFGVLIDPFARAPDKSDMGYGFIFEPYSKDTYEAKWPEATATDFPTQGTGDGNKFEWRRGDEVIVAEYWIRETEARKLYLLDDGATTDTLPPGLKAARERDIEVVSIVSYMISGKQVLSGPHAWAGTVGIPICFIPGEESTIEGATQRKGMVRDAKDPQRILNYARSTETESVALQPKAPYLITVNQIKGYEAVWQTAGTKNHPFLPYNVDPLAPGVRPERAQPPVMSTGLTNLSQQAGMDMHDVTGIYPASLGAKSNETSGVAIRARQHEGDTGSNYISDNTRRAIAYCGRILCDLIPKVMDNERIVRILKEDGSHEMAMINADPTQPQPAGADPKMKIIDSLADGKYDVVVSTGPSYLTRQQEMAETIVELARTMPIVGQAAPDLLVKALNFPGGDEIAKRLEKMLPPGLTEDGPMQQPPPDPEKVASTLEKAASADLKHAQAAKTLLEADALAAQMATMGAQLGQLTQLVMSLGQQAQQPPQAPQPVGDDMPALPPGGPMPMPPDAAAPPPDGDEEIVDMPEGAPV